MDRTCVMCELACQVVVDVSPHDGAVFFLEFAAFASDTRPGVGKADGTLELLLCKLGTGSGSAPVPRPVEAFEVKVGAADPGVSLSQAVQCVAVYD